MMNAPDHTDQRVRMDESSPDPPFQETYKTLFNNLTQTAPKNFPQFSVMEEIELPLIDLNKLDLGDSERESCKKQIARASQEWGFFQVINHGISVEILEKMRREQLSWSEAFHVSLSDILGSDGLDNLSSTMEQYATTVSELAQKLADILAEKMGHKSVFIKETCLPSTCYLRMNRYPPCPMSPQMFGIMPHTDSDFLTVLHQDHIGGLQLVKDGKWIAVKPNPKALIINIGDLFQAWSNNVYKSVEHRVVANELKERYSTAYFLCPSYDTVIQSCIEPSVYKRFSFGEYRQQVQEDVKCLGYKIGLPRFLVPSH
ncbi:Gibberellin 2-beta-dioxygenase 8 [Abeliophyllum distichum]|uniref:Gibberellin 2-beta-dioxygenase 8 n=1 Tax=Abeliophyllum distichum TaxID=126358 RepID=A0ABD1PTC6_9LAMI